MKTKTKKPKTIYALFKGHPERWTKVTFARDANGEPCLIAETKAESWCLWGAVELVHPQGKWPKILNTLRRHVAPLTIPGFNDGASFEEVLALVKKAKV